MLATAVALYSIKTVQFGLLIGTLIRKDLLPLVIHPWIGAEIVFSGSKFIWEQIIYILSRTTKCLHYLLATWTAWSANPSQLAYLGLTVKGSRGKRGGQGRARDGSRRNSQRNRPDNYAELLCCGAHISHNNKTNNKRKLQHRQTDTHTHGDRLIGPVVWHLSLRWAPVSQR